MGKGEKGGSGAFYLPQAGGDRGNAILRFRGRKMDNHYENGTKEAETFHVVFLLQLLQKRSVEFRSMEQVPLR